jgi:ABC-type glycerol-3-phosphate transport system permease component
MLSLSLKTEIDNIAYPPIFIPNPPTLASYVEVFEKNKILLYFRNSSLVTGGASLLGLVIGVPAGYGITRARAAEAAILILIARMTPALSYLPAAPIVSGNRSRRIDLGAGHYPSRCHRSHHRVDYDWLFRKCAA